MVDLRRDVGDGDEPSFEVAAVQCRDGGQRRRHALALDVDVALRRRPVDGDVCDRGAVTSTFTDHVVGQ